MRPIVLPVLAAAATAQGFSCDYAPTQREVVLNTDFTMIAPVNCPPVAVAGGVFTFRNVRIPLGVTVRGEGSRPMIWIVSGDFVVDGRLHCDGRDGTQVDTLQSANFPTPGGIGVCSSAAGGRGSPSTTGTSARGEPGFGALGLGAAGGRGGLASCQAAGAQRGSGGGGGTFTTAGDPWYPLQASGSSMVQQLGQGGWGSFGVLAGGAPGARALLPDGRDDNDFFGLGVDLNRRILIAGELPFPVGGSGGGGGGDRAVRCSGNPDWVRDAKGGGGGGGGGALVIFALGRVVVGAEGSISCDGGDGGGGEAAGSNLAGGGGGAGSGGMVMLRGRGIELHVKGETYANGDHAFVLSADGGIGGQGSFGGQPIAGKYPPPPRATFDARGSGGLGGMGLVQLLAPIGANADGTNTHLDDGIALVRNGVRLIGADKQRYLAWRGIVDGSGIHRDDFGRAVTVGANEGDIRPTPVLLPAF